MCHLDPSSRLATTDMGRKLGVVRLWEGGAGYSSNTMWPRPRPTWMQSFILIHPNVWPQYIKVTDRQAGQTGQRSDSIGRTVLQRVAQNGLGIRNLCLLTCRLHAQYVMLPNSSLLDKSVHNPHIWLIIVPYCIVAKLQACRWKLLLCHVQRIDRLLFKGVN